MMAESTVHTGTTTTTSTTRTTDIGRITINMEYLKSKSGILKICEMVLAFLSFIIVRAAWCWVSGATDDWFLFVFMTCIWTTMFLFFIFFTSLYTRLSFANWMLVDLVHNAVWTLLTFLAATIELAQNGVPCTRWGAHHGPIIGSIFALLCVVAFAADTFFAFLNWRNKQPPTNSPT